MVDNEREARYAEAICGCCTPEVQREVHADQIAAVIAVADEEQAEMLDMWRRMRHAAFAAEAKLREVAIAPAEFADDDTKDLPEWGGHFERGAMWGLAEASRLLRAVLEGGAK